MENKRWVGTIYGEPTGERTRTIWEGTCSGCGEYAFVPETENRQVKSMSRWCETCKRAVDCTKLMYTGPELDPMPPDEHHIWCNGGPQSGPVKGCRWCCYQDKKTGLWDGFWMRYPYNPISGPDPDFTKRHFPGAKIVG